MVNKHKFNLKQKYVTDGFRNTIPSSIPYKRSKNLLTVFIFLFSLLNYWVVTPGIFDKRIINFVRLLIFENQAHLTSFCRELIDRPYTQHINTIRSQCTLSLPPENIRKP